MLSINLVGQKMYELNIFCRTFTILRDPTSDKSVLDGLAIDEKLKKSLNRGKVN